MAVPNTAGLPSVFFTEGTRLDETVTLTLKNNTAATSGYPEITDRANEQTTTQVNVPYHSLPPQMEWYCYNSYQRFI